MYYYSKISYNSSKTHSPCKLPWEPEAVLGVRQVLRDWPQHDAALPWGPSGNTRLGKALGAPAKAATSQIWGRWCIPFGPSSGAAHRSGKSHPGPLAALSPPCSVRQQDTSVGQCTPRLSLRACNVDTNTGSSRRVFQRPAEHALLPTNSETFKAENELVLVVLPRDSAWDLIYASISPFPSITVYLD